MHRRRAGANRTLTLHLAVRPDPPHMNEQPFERPPRWWGPQLTPWFVRATSPLRRRELIKKQRFTSVEFQGLEHLQRLLREGHGVLITPNHSFHYDSYFLIEAGVRVARPFYFMAAWQVFAMSRVWEKWYMQRHGCFSVDREGNDLRAFRQATTVLQESSHPLVIFPEGDIYHTNDRVTPFREGAGAVALAAVRKGKRPISATPCALKVIYVEDPVPQLESLMTRLEERLLLRPHRRQKLSQRIYRFGDAILSLRELEFTGSARSGPIPDRVRKLIGEMLDRQELQFGVRRKSNFPPERVKELRRRHIDRMHSSPVPEREELEAIRSAMEELFTIIQMYSYPGDYVSSCPSVERIAETLDKFEEDVFRVPYPAIRGARRVVVRFGESVTLAADKSEQPTAAELSKMMEVRVQQLIDEINRDYPPRLLE